nr:WD repeat-containing protein 55 isoform X2 [Parasteatoda tepidariorum]
MHITMSSNDDELADNQPDVSGDDSFDDSDLSDSSDDEEGFHFDEDDTGDIEQKKEVPKDIDFKYMVVGICCHPKKDLVAVGTISGPVDLYSFSRESTNKEILSYVHHKHSCRAVKFSESGEHLFTASKDTTICVVDMESNSVYRKFSRVSGLPIYSLLPIDNYLLAAGEDEGQVVLWDFRMQNPIQVFEDCEDFISSMAMKKEKRVVLAASGDGRIVSYNLRAMKMDKQSEYLDVELLSLGIFKDGSKVAVGGGDGAINIFNFGEFGNISDRFPGHPGSVDSMAVLSDDVLCTGCEDGKIRVVQLFPNRFLGVLGGHKGFAVEGLSLSHDSSLLASCSYDQKVKFWDLSSVNELKEQDVKETKKKHQQVNKQVNSFFDDL